MTPPPAAVRWRGRALLFDLFGTLVFFAPRLPTVEVAGSRWRSAMSWLRTAAARELPDVSFDDLLATLMQVTEDIVRQRPPEYREVPSRERFRRALVRLGVDAARAPAAAERLSLAHMAHLASLTVLPAEHLPLLQRLAGCYRLALVSNFDHAPTARRILAAHGIAGLFAEILISDELGRRKPHAAIFETALCRLGVAADEALFIGDSIADDVVGAHNAHLPVVWLNAKGEPPPAGIVPPEHVITRLSSLPALLDLDGAVQPSAARN